MKRVRGLVPNKAGLLFHRFHRGGLLSASIPFLPPSQACIPSSPPPLPHLQAYILSRADETRCPVLSEYASAANAVYPRPSGIITGGTWANYTPSSECHWGV